MEPRNPFKVDFPIVQIIFQGIQHDLELRENQDAVAIAFQTRRSLSKALVFLMLPPEGLPLTSVCPLRSVWSWSFSTVKGNKWFAAHFRNCIADC
jgi:hypothetical protein